MLRLVRRRGPGDMPRAVGGLIAGIALVDAVFLAASAGLGAALLGGGGVRGDARAAASCAGT